MQYPEQSFEQVNESAMIRSMEGRINLWNRSAAELYGWKEEEAVGRISHDLLQTQFPKPLEEIESELVRNGRWEGMLVHTARDGSRVVVESRWTLGCKEPLQAVFEINKPLPDSVIRPQDRATTGAGTLAIQPPGQTSNPTHPDNFLLTIAKIADFVLIAGSALAFLLTVYVIYYYSLSGERELPGSVAGILYALPAGFTVFLVSALWWRPANRINLAMVCLASAISLYSAELFLQSMDRPRPIWAIQGLSNEEKQKAAVQIAEQFGVKFDIRERIEVMADLRKTGVDAVPAIIPRNLLLTKDGKEILEPEDLPIRLDEGLKSPLTVDGKEVIPLGGVSGRTTVLCNESGRWITYPSDEHGFNNPQGLWRSRQIDIAALGDSFTQGYCVPPEKSFVGVIRGRYPATLNLGMAGNGPLYMLASLREYLPNFKPKIVLWFYFEGNDLPELQVENKSTLLNQYLNTGFRQGLSAEQDKLDQALSAYIEKDAAIEATKRAQINENSEWGARILDIIKANALRQRLGISYGKTLQEQALPSAVRGSGMYQFRDILSQANADVGDWGGTLYFVYLPDWGRYVNAFEAGAQQRTQVLDTVKSLGVPVIDIHPAFEARGDPLSFFPFRESAHYNEEGHRVVAQEVLKSISPNGPRQRDNRTLN